MPITLQNISSQPGTDGYLRASNNADGLKRFNKNSLSKKTVAFFRDPAGKKNEKFRDELLSQIGADHGADIAESVSTIVKRNVEGDKKGNKAAHRQPMPVWDARKVTKAAAERLPVPGQLGATAKDLRVGLNQSEIRSWETGSQEEDRLRNNAEILVRDFAKALATGNLPKAQSSLSDAIVGLDGLQVIKGTATGRHDVLDILVAELKDLPLESLKKVLVHIDALNLDTLNFGGAPAHSASQTATPPKHPLAIVMAAYTAKVHEKIADAAPVSPGTVRYLAESCNLQTAELSLYGGQIPKVRDGLLQALKTEPSRASMGDLTQLPAPPSKWDRFNPWAKPSPTPVAAQPQASVSKDALKAAVEADLARRKIAVTDIPGTAANPTISRHDLDSFIDALHSAMSPGDLAGPHGSTLLKPRLDEALLALLSQDATRRLTLKVMGQSPSLFGNGTANPASDLARLLQPLVTFTMMKDAELKQALRREEFRRQTDAYLHKINSRYSFEQLAISEYVIQNPLRKLQLVYSDLDIKLGKEHPDAKGPLRELASTYRDAPEEIEVIATMLNDPSFINNLPREDRALVGAYGKHFQALLAEIRKPDGTWNMLMKGTSASIATPVRDAVTKAAVQHRQTSSDEPVASDEPATSKKPVAQQDLRERFNNLEVEQTSSSED